MENSPFRKIPAELRNQIYHLVLVDKKKIILNLHDERLDSTMMESYHDRAGISGIRLIETCKEIHSEAAPVFYGANLFVVKTELFTSNSLYKMKYGEDSDDCESDSGADFDSDDDTTSESSACPLEQRASAEAQHAALGRWLDGLGQHAPLLRQVVVQLGTWRTCDTRLTAQQAHDSMQKFTRLLYSRGAPVKFSMWVQWRFKTDIPVRIPCETFRVKFARLYSQDTATGKIEKAVSGSRDLLRSEIERAEDEDEQYWGPEAYGDLAKAERLLKEVLALMMAQKKADREIKKRAKQLAKRKARRK
jgi:hypothetical protein